MPFGDYYSNIRVQRKAHYSYVKNFLKIKANFKCDSPPFCNSWKLSNFQQLFSSVYH